MESRLSTSAGDLSTPNSAYFDRADNMINLAAKHGIAVFLDPAETGGWLPILRNNGPAKAYNYGQFLGRRYKSFPNIVWMSGNDFLTWNSSSADNNLVGQVMAGIASIDSSHLQTVELNYNKSYSNQDAALSPFPGAGCRIYLLRKLRRDSGRVYNSSPVRPTFLVESNYEYENDTGFFRGTTGTLILREQEYWTMTSGACGHLYGNKYTWPFKSSQITTGRSFDTGGVLWIRRGRSNSPTSISSFSRSRGGI